MKINRQLGFEILDDKNVRYFGGAYLKNSNPKHARPVSTKKSMHLVMRSSMAKGIYSFLRSDRKVRRIVNAQSKIFGVKVYRFANGGNHLHLIILPRSRSSFNNFIRAVTGLIARVVVGAEKGRPKNLQFWDKRPFTRIIEWGRDYKIVSRYLLQNNLEAWGFIPFTPRKNSPSVPGSTS